MVMTLFDKVPCVYLFTCTANGLRYIGQTTNAMHRIRFEHLIKLNKGEHENIMLQRCWTKYGSNNFRIEIIWQPSYEITSTLDPEGVSRLCRVMEATYGYAMIEAGQKLMNISDFDRWGGYGNAMYSQERRVHLSAALRKTRSNKERNLAILAITHGPHAIAKRRAAMLDHWSKGNTREKVAAYWSNPENRIAHGIKMKLLRESEEFLSAQKAGMARTYRPVRCIDTGEIFESVNAAGRAKSVAGTHITRSIKREIKAGGLRWEYA